MCGFTYELRAMSYTRLKPIAVTDSRNYAAPDNYYDNARQQNAIYMKKGIINKTSAQVVSKRKVR